MPPGITTPTKGGFWLRSTIELLPESKKELLIDYFDDAIVIADLGVQKFRSKDIEGLYNIFSQIIKDQKDINQFQQFVNELENAYGEIESLEYRNQALEYGLDTLKGDIDLTKAASHTYYAITTTMYKGKGLFLDISVYQKDGLFGVIGIQFTNYGNNVPSWLQYPNAKVAP